jgi:hypothetical protein
MRGGSLPAQRLQRVDPPAQTHLAEQRLRHLRPHLVDFHPEGVKRVKMAAPLGRGEQGGEPEIAVLLTQRRLA